MTNAEPFSPSQDQEAEVATAPIARQVITQPIPTTDKPVGPDRLSKTENLDSSQLPMLRSQVLVPKEKEL